MKSRYFNRYSFIYVVLATLLLISSPVWGWDETTSYYRIYGTGSPYLKLDDTGANDADWYIRTDWNLNEGFEIRNYDGSYYHPFRIENRCPSNLLYLDSNGRIGIRTNAPAYTVDAIGNRIRLRNTTAGGARTIQMRTDGFAVDLMSENADLFIRSIGNDILMNPWADGNVGIGTTGPSRKLHVAGSHSATLGSSNITARIENTTGTVGPRHMLQLINHGNPLLWFLNTSNGVNWSMNPIGSNFNWSRGGTGMFEMELQSDGDLIIAGTLTQNSDRNMKENIQAVDPNEVLKKVAELPISRWQFKHDTDKNRHLGPMAQDFYAAFGLGRDEKGIAPGDVSGVALAAIKGLYSVVKEKDAKIAQLEEQLKIQQGQITKLSALEPVVATLVEQINSQGVTSASFNPAPTETNSF